MARVLSKEEIMNSTIETRVEGGRLKAWISMDPNYPGISIEFLPDNPSNESVSFPMVLMEKPVAENVLHALLWTEPELDDYTEEIIFKEPKQNTIEVPNFSDRMAKISAKAKRDREKQEKEKREEQQALVKAKEDVKKLSPRIKALIDMANACRRENITFPTDTGKFGYGFYDGRRGYNFLADSIEHHVGFIKRSNTDEEISYIGICNDGYDEIHDFYVDEAGYCYKQKVVPFLPADNINDILKFLEEFEKFEQAFYNWIDSFDTE